MPDVDLLIVGNGAELSKGDGMPLLVDQARCRLAGRVKTLFVAAKPFLASLDGIVIIVMMEEL